MNVDKRKTVHFFNDRSNQVVFSSVGNLYRIFSAICSPYCLCCSTSVRLSPSCRMLSGCWKSWMSGSNPGGMQSGFRPVQRISQYTRMPCNRFRASMPRPGGRLSAGTGKFFKEPRSLLPVAARRRIFSYQTVDKTLTFHFLRATLELPTGQYWPRGNICLGGSLCRKLKKKR